MQPQKINFLEARDFGELFNASIKFMKQNFKSFFGSVILIAGPFLLIASIAAGFYQNENLSQLDIFRPRRNPFEAILSWEYLISIISSLLGHLALMGSVYEYILIYMEKGPGQVTASEVGSRFFRDFWKILSMFLVFFFFLLVIIMLIALVFVGLASGAPALAILLGVLMLIGLLIVIPPLYYWSSAIYLHRLQTDDDIFDSFRAVRLGMRGNFWWTWAIMFVTLFAIGIVAVIFALPVIIISAILGFTIAQGGDSSTMIMLITIVTAVTTFLSSMLYAYYYSMVSLHYFSLREKKEGLGLMQRIEEMGKPKDDTTHLHY